VITTLDKVNALIAHNVDQAMFFGDAPRPDTWPKVFERFWFAKPAKRFAHYALNEVKDFERNTLIGFNPKS
jgi:hypothetical protein